MPEWWNLLDTMDSKSIAPKEREGWNPSSGTIFLLCMFYVYILQSLKDKKTYVGFCKDIKSRLKEHNFGKVKATRYRRPLQKIYCEAFNTKEEAKKREKYWKSGAGRKKLKEYFKCGFPPSPLGEGEARLVL